MKVQASVKKGVQIVMSLRGKDEYMSIVKRS